MTHSPEWAKLEELVKKHFKTPYPDNARNRTYICAIISEMLDNPGECEIYKTTECYDRLELLLTQAHAEGRKEGMERCARIADEYSRNTTEDGESATAREIAQAIRSATKREVGG